MQPEMKQGHQVNSSDLKLHDCLQDNWHRSYSAHVFEGPG